MFEKSVIIIIYYSSDIRLDYFMNLTLIHHLKLINIFNLILIEE